MNNYLLCFLVLLSCQVQGWAKNAKPPHIIMIMADDMGWNDVGFHGSNEIPTPNIDALAYAGVILNRHYSLPICSPSRAAYLTGRYAIRMGMQGRPLRPAEPRGVPLSEKMLPEYLKSLGYTTNLLGKWHVGYYTGKHTPTLRGFDSFTGYYSGYVKYFDHTISVNNHSGTDCHKNTGHVFKPFRSEKYLTDLISDEAEEIIRSHDQSKPLYLQVSHLAPHASEGVDTLEVPDLRKLNKTLGYIPDLKRRKYAGIVKALDDSVGKLMIALKETGMLQNSVVVFISDNGAPGGGTKFANHGSNYPLRGAKITCFEGAVRVPALVFSPLIKKRSRVSEKLMSIVDWLPTLLKVAGGDPREIRNLDGIDQWSMISEDEGCSRDSVLINIDEILGWEGAIEGKFKLVKGDFKKLRGYEGHNGNAYSPNYDIKSVKSSLAGKVIGSLFDWKNETNKKIMQIRAEATITCKRSNHNLNCPNGCLFDILADPCETTDISDSNPKVYQSLMTLIDGHRANLVNQTTANCDPAGYPDRFDGFWIPWLNNEYDLTTAAALN